MNFPNLRRYVAGFAAVVILVALSGCDPTSPGAKQPGEVGRQGAPNGGTIEVVGRTQPVPGKHAMIAPVPLHPVVEVLVAPGDRVKKGQSLVKLDDDEAQADVRTRQAALENAQVSLKEARRYLGALEKPFHSGAVPEQRYHEGKVALLKGEADERAAKAALDSAKAELEHYEVPAPIDGVISWLDVRLGMVSRPGTTTWGEILDLSEIDVRAELPPDQVERVAVGQTAEVLTNGNKTPIGKGKVVFVGIAADRTTGLVPIVVRLANPDLRLRAGVPVIVRLTPGQT